MKRCTECGEEKPLSDYYFEKDRPRSKCKVCHRKKVNGRGRHRILEVNARSRAKHREKNADRERLRREREGAELNRRRRYKNATRPKPKKPAPDPAVVAARQAARRARKREHNKRYYAANSERWEIYRRKREASKAGVPFEAYTRREIYDRDEGHCRLCDCKLEFAPRAFQIDHIVPISLGGPDTPANVQLACPPCNRAKWATLDGQIHFGC